MRISEIAANGNFLRLIELFPPGFPVPELMKATQKFDLALRFEKVVESINALESLADGFSLPELKDSERVHLNSVGLASELKKRTGAAIIPTLTLRDANKQNILGTVAYAIYAGIENLLVVRGDPYPASEKTQPMNVYDIKNISRVVTQIRQLEEHLVNQDRLSIVAPINLLKVTDQKYLELIKSRELSGVDLFLAESLFEDVETYLDRVRLARKEGISLPIVHTIFPFRGYEDAISCMTKYGWTVSKEELKQLKAKGPDYGVKLANERYHALLSHKTLAQGACISTRGDTEVARLITS